MKSVKEIMYGSQITNVFKICKTFHDGFIYTQTEVEPVVSVRRHIRIHTWNEW